MGIRKCVSLLSMKTLIPVCGLLFLASGSGAFAATDFKQLAKSVVMVKAQVPASARTAENLGTVRQGSGIVIDDKGLVLTIGYLIMEAERVIVSNDSGAAVEARFVAYDHATGFGLVRATEPLNLPVMKLGQSSDLQEKSVALVVSLGGPEPMTPVQVVSRRTFAGYWEYLLESAIFTMPAHQVFGGAALIDEKGELVGVGSLFVNDAMEAETPMPGNMFVPIDLLKPVFDELVAKGRQASRPAPWLGIYTNAQGGRVFVGRVANGGPAEQAGIKAGDIIMGVGGKRVADIADFYRRVRDSGRAGVDVDIDLLPMGAQSLEIKKISVKSADRHDWLKMPQTH